MKMTLTFLTLIPLVAWAVQKNPDIKAEKKLLNTEYSKAVGETRAPDSERNLPQDIRASQDRSHQLDSKETRQFEEEDPGIQE